MDEISKKMVCIMKDGVIDRKEKEELEYITKALEEIAGIIIEVKQRMNI